MSKIIMLSGGFDPLHLGHLEMINMAAKHGRVVIALNSDEWLTRKKGKPFMTWKERAGILFNIKNVYDVIPVDDSDGTVVDALRTMKPSMFGNGGDRKEGNTPELEYCLAHGIEPIFDLGKKIQSSSELIRNANTPVQRAWGEYVVLFEHPQFKVKLLRVNPGCSLSLQRHKHRNEHWISSDDFYEYVEAGHWHRLSNNSNSVLEVVEIQTGACFDEDDIERVPVDDTQEFSYKIIGLGKRRDFTCHIPNLQNFPNVWGYVLRELGLIVSDNTDSIEILPTEKETKL